MNYRNKKLLEILREAPCQNCGISDGTVVAAHSNQLRDGKGRSIKSHDFRTAALCYNCHMRIDQGKESREVREALWEESYRKSIAWLFLNDHLEVK